MFHDPLTAIHSLLSLAAIGVGIPAIAGFFNARMALVWRALFLASAVATSVTGFLLPIAGVTPAVVVGVIALAILGVVLAAQYVFHLAGAWHGAYVIGMVASLYLLVFVAIAQAFNKVALLHAWAPTGTEWPFAAAQAATLIAFVALGVRATRTGHPTTYA